MKNNKTNFIIVFLFGISVCLNIYFLLKKSDETNSKRISPLPPAPEDNLYLVSPLKQTDYSETPETLHYEDLKPKLLNDILAKKDEIDLVGLFLQDSRTGAWLGINEKEGFVPASLLKIPILMATLKEFERGKIKLTDSIELIQSDLDKNSGDLYKVGVGTKLTYWDLIEKMILASDNTAKNALYRQLTPEENNAVFTHVGIPNPYDSLDNPTVTPRDYIRLFKSLYFSTFLPPSLSQKALDLATDTKVESLISAGVPKEITVSHKYGERPNGISDCGIVYTKPYPYFLCIMVKTSNPAKARDLIASLSKTIYESISIKATLTPAN